MEVVRPVEEVVRLVEEVVRLVEEAARPVEEVEFEEADGDEDGDGEEPQNSTIGPKGYCRRANCRLPSSLC